MPTDTSIFLQTVGPAAAFTAVLNWLRQNPRFTWIGPDDGRLALVLRLVYSAILAAGLHYTWTEDTRVLAITIPQFADVAHGVWSVIVQWGWTEISHRLTR